MINVTFVCLGNICRSPMAEGVFRHLVKEAGLEDQFHIDSCGTGSWHVGENPHRGTQRVLKDHGISYSHRARQLKQDDLKTADYLIAMDSSNLSGIKRMGPSDAEIGLLLDYAADVSVKDVPDPYYQNNFEHVYNLVEAGCKGLLQHIRQQHGL